METKRSEGRRLVHSKFTTAVLLCIACVAINVVGARIALLFDLPVYLDSLGTILASIIGGYVPGIAVGYATNLVNSLTESASIYYGVVNVVIAIITAYLARRRWFEKMPTTLLTVLMLAAVCGLMGSVISLSLTPGGFESDVATPVAQQIHAMWGLDEILSRVIAGFFTNFVDKTLVVLFAVLAYDMLPERFLSSLDFAPWQQAPISPKEYDEVMSEKPRRVSLATKVVILVAAIITIVAVATTAFSYFSYHRSMIEAESTKANDIATLMESVVDPERVNEFLEEGDAAPGYKEVEDKLATMRDSFGNVQYVYVYQIQPDGCHVVLDPDTAEEPGSDPGAVIEFDESFKESLPSLLAGDEIEPVISDETYGWLLTVYKPLKNRLGKTVAYVAVDVSMDRLIADEASFLVGIIVLFAAFFMVVCAFILWLSRYSVIIPVNSIAHASNGFMLNGEDIGKESLAPIEALDIHTGDELENLYLAVMQMAQEAVRYIDESREQSDTINRMQSNLIMVMADLVESRDKFTGDHVRNTASYARIIMNQMRREGICSDQLTNEFISNVYQSAPLHDIGKIAVSDTILNKPGRLTEEEFAIMKSHTIAGQQILESAKSAVSESSYLDEAQRLAAYHHEKWDGSGYPYGLAGEDIPLSARIMAVADVFDALVSKRSYKAGFPIEKAFAIIEEGIGTHFDPQVARAFLHARDKAAAVAEKSNEKKRLEEEAAKRKEAENDSDAPSNSAS